ncbi:MAG TPA: nitroreductase family protein [Candidatus Pacearchaeota archaeon]|nr:NADPH-dependent oxidoreductase [archaeon BMS3Abin17]HDK42197.1 nitroreductase family protein [Candidatus Pacearchaeota archaeon]HDZ60362.1 nitroreductase family protein [Candidatus Pacearchaeota archaeon]
MELNKAIQNRHSTKRFKDKKPDWRDIIECIDATRYAPMAGNNFTPQFILVDDEKIIQKLAEAAQQNFISEAKYVVVVCSNPSRTLNAYEERGEMYVKQQVGASIQNFLLKIEEAGLSTCWVGEFVDEQVKRALKIPAKIYVEAILPVGYDLDKKREKKPKIDIDRILYFNKYDNKKMRPPRKLGD